MSKLRKILITVLLACLTVCVAFAVAACGGKNMSPNFRNPGTTDEGSEYRGKYVISVKSIGGLALSNITVTAKKGGNEIATGISSNEGKIEFGLPAGEYELVVDEEKLPAGYYVPAGTSFTTTADKENAEVVISSKVISQTMTSGTRYSVGDIMHNFSFTNSYGIQLTLEELFKTKRAVVLNFWYTECSACKTEFPALERAYKAYADTVSVVALDSTDSADEIAKFQSDWGLTFHCARDNAGITGAFGVTAFPTTVVIDRYGVIAEVHVSSIPQESAWKALFNKYASDDYTQDDPSDSGNNETPTERTKFDGSVEMPASSVFKANVLGEGTDGKIGDFSPETNEKDVPYTWPWIIGEGGGYMTASNSKKPYSYATVYIDLTLQSGDALSYEYKVDTEAGNDILFALINGQIVGEHSGNSTGTAGSNNGWVQNYGVYVADHTVNLTLSFIYIKDPLKDDGTDTASIRNITITDVTKSETAIDQRVSVIDGETLSNGSYGISDKLTINQEDGYYYYSDDNGEKYLLLANINQASPWTEKHFGADTFIPISGVSTQPSSLYRISYWYMSNRETADKDGGLKFTYGDQKMTDTIIRNYYLQEFSDNQLTPLTENLKNAIIEFTKAYAEEHKNDGDKAKYGYYEDQWLEMCYFYRHYGFRHDTQASAEADKDNCFSYKDPVKGLIAENAFAINIPGNSYQFTVNKTKIMMTDYGGGLWYKITLPAKGIYHFTTTINNNNTDPRLALYYENNNSVGEIIFDETTDLRYDKFTRNSYENSNIFKYQVLEAGTYFLQCDTAVPNNQGNFNVKIERLPQTSINMIKVCSTAEGMWTYTLDGFIYYLAVPTVLGQDGIYYYNDNNSYGSKIYIDFVHGNYFDNQNHSLEWLINNNYFGNNTSKMKEFLSKSKQGKRKSDPDYGLLEASSELVNMLANFIQNFNSNFAGDGLNTGAWKMFACYYEYYNI